MDLTKAPPFALLHSLASKWTIPPPLFENRAMRSKNGIAAGTGANAKSGEEIYNFLSHLAQRRAPGLDSVFFLECAPAEQYNSFIPSSRFLSDPTTTPPGFAPS